MILDTIGYLSLRILCLDDAKSSVPLLVEKHPEVLLHFAKENSVDLDTWKLMLKCLQDELNSKSEHEEWIKNNAWDLIPILVEPANEENLQQCPQVVHTCSQILADFVAKFGNPKEIFISLLEQCEHSGSSIRFRHCLPALEISLLKLNLRSACKTWDWALRTVIDHITDLQARSDVTTFKI